MFSYVCMPNKIPTCIKHIRTCRRKFRSQTSDNMDTWKSRGGKSQRREEQKREDQRRERVRRKKMQVREKVGKSRITVLFQWFVAPEGRKVGPLKRRVRSHLARSVDSLCHLWFTTTNLSYRFPFFETSATALCGTTGIHILLVGGSHTWFLPSPSFRGLTINIVEHQNMWNAPLAAQTQSQATLVWPQDQITQ